MRQLSGAIADAAVDSLRLVDVRTFLGLEPTDDRTRWRLPVTPAICTGFNFLFGGAALAAAVEALEEVTGRPLVWVTAQYLSFVRSPSVLEIEVVEAVVGNQTTQARAIGTADGTEIITVNAALGSREMETSGRWIEPPDVLSPDACPPREHLRMGQTGIGTRLDTRIAAARPLDQLDGTSGTGRSSIWLRALDGVDVTAATLALFGDHMPFGIGQALGLPAGGNSLDNTLRVVEIVPTEWVLLDIHICAVANGFAHGHLDMWSQDGTFLATASQSAVVRFWKD